MADKPCNTCQNYDPIIRGKDATGRHGRCAAKSTYPAKEQSGQVFPSGVKREAPGTLAKAVIVRGDLVEATCTLYRLKPAVKRVKS